MISIVIIVKNDRKIATVLEALNHIRKPDTTEVIVVDASEGKLDDIKRSFDQIRWINFVSKTNKRITIPEQRNVGIAQAKGKIIVFIDSDCNPHNDWLVNLTKPIIEEGEHIVAGRVKLAEKHSIHNLAQDNHLHKKYVQESPTMNLAVLKELYTIMGGYDESFQFGSDVDFSWRAIRAGYKIRFTEKAIIYHDLGNTKHEIRRMYFYGKARTRLYKKHSYKLRFFWGNEFLTIFYPLYFLFLPITFFFPWYPFFMLFPIIKYRNKNPKKLILMKTMYGAGVLKPLFFSD